MMLDAEKNKRYDEKRKVMKEEIALLKGLEMVI